ncbi:tetratricopeptide repeat protein 9C-like isoform X2 [Narcine bancroftii]|uniref:tetratricopeptide repeat protein 9C-like isoform X2 n=1 Tax=Narcine bancroftii TaxID=1343680 RepID=UPI003831A78C
MSTPGRTEAPPTGSGARAGPCHVTDQACLGVVAHTRLLLPGEGCEERVKSHGNAACLLLSEKVNYERVRDYCLKVLERQRDNTKALYRAGVALYNMGNYDQAQHHLARAAKICPNDANVKRSLRQAEHHLDSYHQKEKAMYRGMFDK